MCPNKSKTCDICGKVGHLAVKCRQADRGGGKKVKDVAGIVCNNCGAVGHIAGQCPEVSRATALPPARRPAEATSECM